MLPSVKGSNRGGRHDRPPDTQTGVNDLDVSKTRKERDRIGYLEVPNRKGGGARRLRRDSSAYGTYGDYKSGIGVSKTRVPDHTSDPNYKEISKGFPKVTRDPNSG